VTHPIEYTPVSFAYGLMRAPAYAHAMQTGAQVTDDVINSFAPDGEHVQQRTHDVHASSFDANVA